MRTAHFQTYNNPSGNELTKLHARITELEQQRARDAAGVAVGGPTVTATVTRRRGRPRKVIEPQQQRSYRAMTNAPRFEELVEEALKLGADKGNGADAQIKFGMRVVEAAYLGALDLDPNKHGTDRRDGIVLAEAYVRGRTGATIFDTKSDSGRKLVSNLDKCIKLGSCPKWGQGQPLQNVNDLIMFRQQEKKAGKKVDDAFNVLMRYATQQLKRDTLIDGHERDQFVYKRDPNVRNAEDILESVRKTLNQLKTGKVANCPDMDTSEEVNRAIKLMTTRLTAIAKAKGSVSTAAPLGPPPDSPEV